MTDAMQKKYDDHMAQHGNRKVSWKALSDFLETALAGVAKRLMPRLEELEKAVDNLKANGPNLADCYRGVWIIGGYKRGSLVTHQGGMWLALKDTDEKPGAGDAFKLVVKAGKDART